MNKARAILFLLLCCSILACNINQNVPLGKVALQLEGNWVNQKYLDTLRLTKSPYRAQHAAAIRLFHIQKDTFDDSNPVRVVLSFEEGDNWVLERDSSGLLFSNAYDADQRLHARLLPNKRLRLGKDVFVRYSNVINQDFEAYSLIEQTLFAGRYEWNGKLVEFAKNGQITGMETVGVEAYDPIVDDYMTGTSIDQLWLKKGEESNRYGFVFKGKKLFIYNLKCPDNALFCAEKVTLGDVAFELKSYR